MAVAAAAYPEQYITGDWKQFTFHVATDKDCNRIVQHFGQHFIPEEPINQHIKWRGSVWDPDREADFVDRVQHILMDRLSFYMTLKGSDEIVAVNLITDSRNSMLLKPRSEITRTILDLLAKVEQDADPIFYSKFPCDYYAHLAVTSVHTNYRGQGIALEMYTRTLTFLTAKGFPVVRSQFSHPGTQCIGKKLEFEELNKMYFKDQMDRNGKRLFPNAVDEFAVATAKRLRLT